MLAQILYLFFILLVEIKVYDKFRRKDISTPSFLFWALFWLSSGFLILWPKTSDYLAQKLGLKTQKGVDLIVDASVAVIFYLIWRIFLRLERIERDLTKITRAISYGTRDKEDGGNNSHV